MTVTAETTDFETYRIRGYARAAMERGWTGEFSVPLISQIEDNLYSGGCRQVLLPEHIKYVVSLYPWEQYTLNTGASRVEVEMWDSQDMPDIDLVHALADLVNTLAAIAPTLVHCQAGLNRSGLITGLALIKRGHTPEDAIALLRNQRCDMVLCNKTFEQWLLKESQ